MNRFLIVYASKHKQTEKISYYMKNKIEERGFFCELHDIDSFEPDLKRFENVIIGGSVYAGKFDRPLVAWAKRNGEQLNLKHLSFFTVSLNAADARPEARSDDKRLINEFASQTGLKPQLTESIAGALKYSEYNFVIRFLMKRISKKAGGPTDTSHDYEMTDWKKVDSFVNRLLQFELLGTESKTLQFV